MKTEAFSQNVGKVIRSQSWHISENSLFISWMRLLS